MEQEGERWIKDKWNAHHDQTALRLAAMVESLPIEIHKTIRQVVKDYAGDGVLCDKEDGIEYAKFIVEDIKKKLGIVEKRK